MDYMVLLYQDPATFNMTDAEPRAKDESWNERRPKPGA